MQIDPILLLPAVLPTQLLKAACLCKIAAGTAELPKFGTL